MDAAATWVCSRGTWDGLCEALYDVRDRKAMSEVAAQPHSWWFLVLLLLWFVFMVWMLIRFEQRLGDVGQLQVQQRGRLWAAGVRKTLKARQRKQQKREQKQQGRISFFPIPV